MPIMNCGLLPRFPKTDDGGLGVFTPDAATSVAIPPSANKAPSCVAPSM